MAANLSEKRKKYLAYFRTVFEALIQAKLSIDTEDENALYTLFESSRDYRNSMPNTSAGPIKKQFAVYCDIIDETGGIATIATYWQAIISVLKISALSTTANLKKAYSESNFMMNPPLPKLLRC